MKWIKYTLKTTDEAEDLVLSAFADAGVDSVEVEDKVPPTEEEKKGMFAPVLPEEQENDGLAYVSFYLEEDADRETILARVREELEELKTFTDIGEGTITVSETEDKDWINNWKEFFHSFRVDNVFIVPSWEDDTMLPTDEVVLHIDPGTAFGTGAHETTKLCILQLKKYIKGGEKVLDVGTGSGILSILALKLGAAYALGTDLDPCTVPAVEDNKRANAVSDEDFRLVIGNIIDDREIKDLAGYETYDIVTANILAEVLVPLIPELPAHMKSGAVLITSGILDIRENLVAEALIRAGFEILETKAMGEWVSITARKN